jgi:hypothetical protein
MKKGKRSKKEMLQKEEVSSNPPEPHPHLAVVLIPVRRGRASSSSPPQQAPRLQLARDEGEGGGRRRPPLYQDQPPRGEEGRGRPPLAHRRASRRPRRSTVPTSFEAASPKQRWSTACAGELDAVEERGAVEIRIVEVTRGRGRISLPGRRRRPSEMGKR